MREVPDAGVDDSMGGRVVPTAALEVLRGLVPDGDDLGIAHVLVLHGVLQGLGRDCPRDLGDEGAKTNSSELEPAPPVIEAEKNKTPNTSYCVRGSTFSISLHSK